MTQQRAVPVPDARARALAAGELSGDFHSAYSSSPHTSDGSLLSSAAIHTISGGSTTRAFSVLRLPWAQLWLQCRALH